MQQNLYSPKYQTSARKWFYLPGSHISINKPKTERVIASEGFFHKIRIQFLFKISSSLKNSIFTLVPAFKTIPSFPLQWIVQVPSRGWKSHQSHPFLWCARARSIALSLRVEWTTSIAGTVSRLVTTGEWSTGWTVGWVRSLGRMKVRKLVVLYFKITWGLSSSMISSCLSVGCLMCLRMCSSGAKLGRGLAPRNVRHSHAPRLSQRKSSTLTKQRNGVNEWSSDNNSNNYNYKRTTPRQLHPPVPLTTDRSPPPSPPLFLLRVTRPERNLELSYWCDFQGNKCVWMASFGTLCVRCGRYGSRCGSRVRVTFDAN